MIEDKNSTRRCAHIVSHSAWSSSTCSRIARYFENGNYYCKQHIPSVIEAKHVERTTKWEAGWDRTKKKGTAEKEMNDAKYGLLAAIRTGHDEDILIAAGTWERLVTKWEAI